MFTAYFSRHLSSLYHLVGLRGTQNLSLSTMNLFLDVYSAGLRNELSVSCLFFTSCYHLLQPLVSWLCCSQPACCPMQSFFLQSFAASLHQCVWMYHRMAKTVDREYYRWCTQFRNEPIVLACSAIVAYLRNFGRPGN